MVADRGHKDGLGGTAYLGEESGRIISAGADGKLCVRDSTGEYEQEVMRGDRTPLTCLAAHHPQQLFATIDTNKAVHVYRWPDNKPMLAARLMLPGMLLSFSGKGQKLVAGGADEMLSIISIELDDPHRLKAQVTRKLRAVPHSRGLAFDPQEEFIAAVAASGMLQIWEAATSKQIFARKQAGPDVIKDKEVRVGLAWNPQGDELALAGRENDVSIFSRSTWQLSQTLVGSHESSVCCLKYSPNGFYLATAGIDKMIMVWNVATASVAAANSFDSPVQSMDWEPDGNSLACMLQSGDLEVWHDVITEDGDDSPGPCQDVPSRAAKSSKQPEPSIPSPHNSPSQPSLAREPTASVENGPEESEEIGHGSEDVFSKGGSDRPKNGNTGVEEDGFDAIMREAQDWNNDPDEPEEAESEPRNEREKPAHGRSSAFLRPQLQDAFQPGSTVLGSDGRRWLAYNALGGISLKEDEGISILETVFHDTIANSRRIAPFRDYHSFTMGSLGEKGGLFAREGNAREEARLMFRPHNALYPNSEWTLNLPLGIRIRAISAGRNFVACSTSDRQLHIFTTAGLQLGIRTLAGPVVALAAQGNLLAAVWHSGLGLESGESHLEYAVLDVNYKTQVSSGPLPVSEGSELKWLAFSEEEQLCSWDSEGILRLRIEEFGGSWVPVLSANANEKEPEDMWPVALTKSEVQYIACRSSHTPPVLPRPSLSRLPLRPAVLSASEGQIAELESDWMRLGSHLALIRQRQEDEEDRGEEVSAEELEDQTALDRILLKLFQDALKTSRLQRAQELAACLHLQRSLEGALKLTNLHRIPVLAQAITRLIAGREEEAAQQQGQYSTPQTTVAPLNSQLHTPSSAAQGILMERNSNTLSSQSNTIDIAAAKSKQGAQNQPPRNALFDSDQLNDEAGKRKASGNPFARKPKAAREQF